jgi:hypothetical protein
MRAARLVERAAHEREVGIALGRVAEQAPVRVHLLDQTGVEKRLLGHRLHVAPLFRRQCACLERRTRLRAQRFDIDRVPRRWRTTIRGGEETFVGDDARASAPRLIEKVVLRG